MSSILARCAAAMRAVARIPASPAPLNRRSAHPRGSLSYSRAATALLAALIVPTCPTLAAPAGGTVVDGSASVSQTGSITNINQLSNKAIINWQGFSIAPKETVNFNQPGNPSATLNRVTGNESSVISGALNANGQ